MEKKLKAFERLLIIMDELREKCPWDKVQTMETLRHLTIEEVYELSDSILEQNITEIKKELGDILLHVVFYARIASESNEFTITEVINEVCDKLIIRHPHIYGTTKVNGQEDVKKNWEQIKLKEGKKSVLEGVPASLPSMVKAMRIQEKARGAGFDWENKNQVWQKVEEELQEFKLAADEKNHEHKKKEFGDLLFSLINYSRFININPDEALEMTNKKFINRFKFMEEEVKKRGQQLKDLKLEEMDVYWNKAKELE